MISLLTLPFLVGLVLSGLLPVLGLYLRLRDEWLSALAIAQCAAAGALMAGAFGLPPPLGAFIAAILVVVIKSRFARAGASVYAMMLVAGWAVALLFVAKVPAAEEAAHALSDGQLYFIGTLHASLSLAAALGAALLLPVLSHTLIRSRLFRTRLSKRDVLTHVAFDLLVCVALVTATLSFGVMSSFALAFFPPWVAWIFSTSWRRATFVAPLLGITIYILVFILAWELDTPFGPLCALLCALTAIPTLRSVRQG